MSLWPNVIQSRREGNRIVEYIRTPTDEDIWQSIHTWEFRRKGVPMSDAGKTDPKAGLEEFLKLCEHDPARAKRQFPRAWHYVNAKGLLK